jgi:hypothetical protein
MAKAIAVAQGKAAPAKPAPEAPAAPPVAAPEAAPVAEAAPVTEAPAGAAEAPAEAKPTPAQSEAALALAKAQKAALQREREAYEAKQRAKQLEAKLKEAEEAASKYKTLNPLDLLKERGLTYEQLTQEIVEGKYKPPTAEQIAVESTKSEVQKLAEELAALKREREEATVRETRAREVDWAREQITAAAEKYPLLSAVKWGPAKAVEAFYEQVQKPGVQPDFEDVLSSLEQAIAADADPIFASDAYLKRLLADQKQKERVLSLLGIKQSQPAQQASTGAKTATANSPAAIPQVKAAEPGTRKTPSKSISPAQRRAAAIAALQAMRNNA